MRRRIYIFAPKAGFNGPCLSSLFVRPPPTRLMMCPRLNHYHHHPSSCILFSASDFLPRRFLISPRRAHSFWCLKNSVKLLVDKQHERRCQGMSGYPFSWKWVAYNDNDNNFVNETLKIAADEKQKKDWNGPGGSRSRWLWSAVGKLGMSLCNGFPKGRQAGRQAARFGGHQNEVLLRTGLLSFLIVSPFRINIVIQHSSLVLGAAAREEEKTVHAN